MKKGAILGLIFLFIAGAAVLFTASDTVAEQPCAEISNMSGKGTLTHNGKVVKLDLGMKIYNNDLIKTQDKSKVEIKPMKNTGFAGTINVAANTAFYFKLADVKGQPSTTLDLMAGQVGMKVAKLTGSPSAQVKTDSAVCGVRGTEFSVIAPSSGNVLVTCDEGEVGLLGMDGDEAAVGPNAKDGQAAERRAGDRFKSLPVTVSSLEQFRDNWYAEEMGVLLSNPSKSINQFAGFYLKKKPAFEAAYAQLAKSAAFAKWKKEDATPGFRVLARDPNTLKELKEVDGPLTAIRKELVMFERYAYRLEEIKVALENTSYADFIIADSKKVPLLDDKGTPMSAKAFFAIYDRDKEDLARKVGEFRYALALHALRNPSGGTGRPGSASEDASTGEFFGDAKDSGGDDFFGK